MQQLPPACKPAYILAALRLARTVRPDVIFCGHLNLLPLARLAARLSGTRLWLQLHGIEAWQEPARRLGRLVGGIDIVTCVSRYTRRRFLAWADIDPGRTRVLPNTVNAEFRSRDRNAARARWQLGDKTVLLTVGRLSSAERYKGQDRVIRCLPDLRQQFPALIYLVAGDGDDRPRLEALVRKLSLSEQVVFLGGIPHHDLTDLYTAADVFAMPSHGEGFGIVFLEAMACGTPALGLNLDGSVDALQEGRLGILSREENLCQTLATALHAPRPAGLSERVQVTFGRDHFTQQVRRLIRRFA
jgi:phosphatidylinositol alpha-1,6-mannosyltransferase